MAVRHSARSDFTLSRLMSVSGEWRWLKTVPPLVIQLPAGGASNSRSENAGAGAMGLSATGGSALRTPAASETSTRPAQDIRNATSRILAPSFAPMLLPDA
jgi:hypothetical protein